MQRRPFILAAGVGVLVNPLLATASPDPVKQLEAASEILAESVKSGQVRAVAAIITPGRGLLSPRGAAHHSGPGRGRNDRS